MTSFKAAYGAKFGKAVAKITDDVDELLAFYDFPAEHWQHLRTTDEIVNPELLDWIVGQRLSYSVGFTLPDTILDELAKIPSRSGNPPTTPTTSPDPVRGSWKSPACWTSHAGQPTCGSSSAANAHTPARSRG